MENYDEACKCRLLDIAALLAGPNMRTTAAAHLGGVAVECRLKALVLAYHNISAWDAPSSRAKDAKFRQAIPRTGHGLVGAVKLMQDVYKAAKSDHLFLAHLNNVNHPTGHPGTDFIALRYCAQEMGEASLREWQKSLQYVLGWLKKNEALI
jgi:hypothetical protein